MRPLLVPVKKTREFPPFLPGKVSVRFTAGVGFGRRPFYCLLTELGMLTGRLLTNFNKGLINLRVFGLWLLMADPPSIRLAVPPSRNLRCPDPRVGASPF